MKPENASQEYPDSQKRKSEEQGRTHNKRQKREQLLETISAESQVENQERCDISEADIDSVLSESRLFLEKTYAGIQEKHIEGSSNFSFRVSCRCSGALAKLFPAQVCQKSLFQKKDIFCTRHVNGSVQ